MKIKYLYIAIALLVSMQATSENTIKEVAMNDTSFSGKLFASYDNTGIPEYYFSDYKCNKGNAKANRGINIRIFWDIWGNFIKVGIPDGSDLTKIDNSKFCDKDYERLHQLLINPHAGIQFYKLDEYTPAESENQYYAVDAISGATVVDASYDCIRGAVKTCYDLYKLVNGNITSFIKSNTQKLMLQNNMDENLIKLTSFIIKEEKVTSSHFNLITSEFKMNNPIAYLSSTIELARLSNYSDKSFNYWLETYFSISTDSIEKTIIYNYLIQNNHKTKSIKNYLISRKI
ncbi:hypothetical protein [Plebeiibacterium sediminum]|uniref:FMN-binding domain-containing protein n=1 Tax=Plebeiibacterium sediminum TaxID=2992112 RepID=A0AAE3M1Z5_9BACT|nr:hypothetical protein [Plebeiobacterium sediminum]MCW3785330.1 hypothetical protein [Plebeiobacterium sediminum]